VLVVQYLLRHPTVEACLGELERNAASRRVVGLKEVCPIPSPWTMSRFVAVLGRPEHHELLREIFAELARRLGQSGAESILVLRALWLSQDNRWDGRVASSRAKPHNMPRTSAATDLPWPLQ
jgi:hypothetical protein